MREQPTQELKNITSWYPPNLFYNYDSELYYSAVGDWKGKQYKSGNCTL